MISIRHFEAAILRASCGLVLYRYFALPLNLWIFHFIFKLIRHSLISFIFHRFLFVYTLFAYLYIDSDLPSKQPL